MDCQKFVENCLLEVGIKKDLPGSNAWFRYMTWVGTPEECKRRFGTIPAGAFLFILEQNGKEPERYKADGIGNASHIGIYTGVSGRKIVEMATDAGVWGAAEYNYGDGAIHSSASKGGVVTSKFAGKTIKGGWNMVGLWNALSYGETVDAILNGERGEQTMATATVTAENGTTVNLRSRESTAAGLVARVPIGAEVEVIEQGDEWCKISANGHTGYMMTKFLRMEDEVEKIAVPKAEAEKAYGILGGCMQQFIVNKGDIEAAYDMIGNWLGLRG